MDNLLIVVSIGSVAIQAVCFLAVVKSHKRQMDYYAAWREKRKEYHSRERAALDAAYTQLWADLESELLQMGVQMSHALQHRDIANVVTRPERMN